MKHSLQLKFSQNLALTPQLQQSIKLLQLSSQELNQELESLLQANPLLERVDGPDGVGGDVPENYAPVSEATSATSEAPEPASEELPRMEEFSGGDDYYESFQGSNRWEEGNSNNDDDNDFTFQEAVSFTLREHLLSQVKLLPLSERDQTLAMVLVDAINDDGYLEQSLEDLAELLPEELEIELLELETTLKHIQNLDPPGIGARDLAECLVLQLKALPGETPHVGLAIKVAEHHLPLLASRDYGRLRKLLHCDDDVLKLVQQLVVQLNPRPGSGFSHIASDHYIQHEIVVKKVKGVWLASLNDEVVPKLRINQLYADILKRNRDSSGQYLTSQMQEAKWMIKNIQQRFSTILRVSQAIVDRQRHFFEHGEVAMRPLVLREIADELGLHESTVSRVTTRKYMLTPRGVYELKYFFGSHVATESGGACSATAIRALIKQMVSEENPKKPLSDNQIADILGKQGIVVARRTIAKYRESLQISAANQRKSL
ncbi:RNA polymerase, sigma 54 subunit, RpoN/SigL [Methylobacillus rhizosphaerae]|uniref:RNA polymerase sigma-54 factor n=1 Tax=Methylobacillus rhizosphaerae TaxID=551994 RepID=A0A238XNV3_9PROT|nr:RNA polymerase factor sigma-54 [Methylobacillus rhizosphaerae]SNR60706.1 RNA polymerase, sigma 54 subunit, RpoN/SigL [Methylobacillus rhizosphaerae]